MLVCKVNFAHCKVNKLSYKGYNKGIAVGVLYNFPPGLEGRLHKRLACVLTARCIVKQPSPLGYLFGCPLHVQNAFKPCN